MHNGCMTRTIELASGGLRATIVPDLGGCVAGLWLEDMPVLRCMAPAELTTARQAGSYPLVPYSNRVGHARLVWNGTSHPLVTHQGNDPHAIHGIGWQRPWQVLEQTDTLLLLSMEHRADAAWPFAFDASQGFRQSGDALEMTLSVTNQSKVPAPVGLGWHPFFVKRPGARIAFDATGRWEMGPDKLPTGRVRSRGMAVDAALLDVDHCFDGWKGAVTLSDEQLAVRVSSSLRRLVVFTNGQRGDIAVEPVSHVNNAINLLQAGHTAESLGVQVLAPGASLSAEMTIQVEHSK